MAIVETSNNVSGEIESDLEDLDEVFYTGHETIEVGSASLRIYTISSDYTKLTISEMNNLKDAGFYVREVKFGSSKIVVQKEESEESEPESEMSPMEKLIEEEKESILEGLTPHENVELRGGRSRPLNLKLLRISP
ncbi:hypothetical protein ACFQL7_20515 [Halocatena marina]|uniref:HMA domain-containing protein n=1 Tax=Halocatena marina TaxID=2934937 RepID=A0ABD5YUQ9_9EURY